MSMTKSDYWFLVMLICTLSLKFPHPGIMDYVLSILSMILFAGSWLIEWLEGRDASFDFPNVKSPPMPKVKEPRK